MDRERPVDQPGRGVQPAEPVRVGDERLVASKGCDSRGPLIGVVVGGLVRGSDVGVVVARPLPFLGIPPYIPLAFGPGPPIRVGRSPVVEDPRVGGPCPAPLAGYPVLL